jgi:hypothetical protein
MRSKPNGHYAIFTVGPKNAIEPIDIPNSGPE